MPRAWRSGISAVSNDQKIWKPHVTVAAICERDNRFLLVRERIEGRLVFNQPAGHLDPGESLEQAVIRETREETAFEFVPRQLVGIYRYIADQNSDKTYLRFAFAGAVGQQHNQALDDEIVSTQWMSLDEIHRTRDQHRSPMVLRCILDYLHRPAYPLEVFSSEFF